MIQLVISRLPDQSGNNIWAHSLQALVLNKIANTRVINIRGKQQPIDIPLIIDQLKFNSQQSCKKIYSLSKEPSSALFKCLRQLSQSYGKHSVRQVKDVFFKLIGVVTVRKNNEVTLKQQVEVVTSEEPPFLPPGK